MRDMVRVTTRNIIRGIYRVLDIPYPVTVSADDGTNPPTPGPFTFFVSYT